VGAPDLRPDVRHHAAGARYDVASVLPRCPLLVAGDAREVLAGLPDRCVQAVVTSPPYWSLRDYDVTGHLGREEPLDEYVKSLTSIFDEVARVLRDDGVLWLNLGDSYTSGGRTWRAPDRKNPARAATWRPATPDGLKPKDLIGVPWRVAFALQDAGWYLRSDVVWYKPNCQPESVGDRPTRSHEHVFLFSKRARYRYFVDAVAGPNRRRLRDAWSIKTVGVPDAHFATFPVELVERCLLLATVAGDLVLDPFMGSGTTMLAAAGLGRPSVGIDLNPEYVEIARRRLVGRG
jgi:site-specific DNA-methyltransferase (cytosine-N4-specific)